MYEYDLLPWACREGDVALDVGANVGQWTAFLAGGFRTVHAIEPNPDAIPQLLENLPANAIHHAVGAWSSATRLSFARFTSSENMSAVGINEDVDTKVGEVCVNCLPLDSLPIEGRVDFIKCDTEGAEIEILQGATDLIAIHRPWLLIEVHSRENLLSLTALLVRWSYLFTTVRFHSLQQFNYPWYYDRCWVSAQARERCPGP